MPDLVLSVDCGTQSLRVMLFDKDGRMLAIEKEEYEPYYPNDFGICEKNPEDYFNAFVRCTKKIGKNNVNKNVKAIVVTTLRDTGVYLDENGKVVRNSMLFLDKRQASVSNNIPFIYSLPSKIVGMYEPIIDTKKQGKTNWMIEHEPENWNNTKHFLLLSGYFHYKLTGKYVDSISNQIGHIPINFKNKKWDNKGGLYDSLFPIDRSKLPEIVETGTIIGELLPELSTLLNLPTDVKIISGASDKGCETLGVGCSDESKMSISFGTAATIQTTSDRYFEAVPFLPAYPAAIPNHYNTEINVYRGYWMIRWFKNEFVAEERQTAEKLGVTPEQILDRIIEKIPPGSDGLMLQPFWKADLKNPDAKGSIIGFTDSHNKYHIYKAIIEGINFALIDGMKKIEKKTRVPVEKIYVSGGAAKSDIVCQITADMFGHKVVRGETFENSGLGAAIIGFVSLGYYKDYDEATKSMVREKQIFLPDEENHKIYSKLYAKVYKKIYPNLKHVYKSLHKLINK